MSEYKPLATALAGFFDRQQSDLPKELQARVEDEFFPIPWDRMSPGARQRIAVQLDSYDDPDLEEARQRGWDLAERKAEIDEQISEWSRVATPTALDLEARNEKLAQLKLQKSQIEAEVRGQWVQQNPVIDLTSKSAASPTAPLPAKNARSQPKTQRERRKKETLAKYEQWRKEHKRLKQLHPNRTLSFYAEKIASSSIGDGKTAETIRKHIR